MALIRPWTDREWSVVHGIVRGWPTKRIAAELAISPRRVEQLVASAADKTTLPRACAPRVRVAVAYGVQKAEVP